MYIDILYYLMYCTHYIPFVLICICAINKDYYYWHGRWRRLIYYVISLSMDKVYQNFNVSVNDRCQTNQTVIGSRLTGYQVKVKRSPVIERLLV